MERYINIWKNNLLKNNKAIDYLKSRGVTENQMIKYSLGVSRLYPRLLENGSIKYNTNDKNQDGVLIFPLVNINLDFVGYITRSITGKSYYKWVNISKPGAFFFGLSQDNLENIWKDEKAIIVEGVFDFFPLERVSPYTVCFTTASVSEDQLSFMCRFLKSCFVCFDSDENGKKSTKKLKYTFTKEIIGGPKIIDMLKPPFKDIGEAWEKLGEEKFQKFFNDKMKSFIALC
jgi:DNA primase